MSEDVLPAPELPGTAFHVAVRSAAVHVWSPAGGGTGADEVVGGETGTVFEVVADGALLEAEADAELDVAADEEGETDDPPAEPAVVAVDPQAVANRTTAKQLLPPPGSG